MPSFGPAAPSGPARDVGVAHAPLTPARFLQRSAGVWGERVATSFRGQATTYAGLLERCERLAGGLHARGLDIGSRVATLLPNRPELLELHFAVPGMGNVLVPLNTRLSVSEYAYILQHAGVELLVTCDELSDIAAAAIAASGVDASLLAAGPEYEALVAKSARVPLGHVDENQLFSINYTSGTTGRPKGVMYTHRGSYLHALGVIAESRLDASSVYLWTLPMFHCHGWAFPWAVTAVGAHHVFLESVDASAIWTAIQRERVTHMCAAPTVVTMMLEARKAAPLGSPVDVFVGGAPPAPSLLARANDLGLRITHLYGLTETYGPIAICAWQPEWSELPAVEQAALRARQGVSTVVSEPLRVVAEQMVDVPADGKTIGEIVMRGNNVAVGYFADDEATANAFAGGWFHSGDLAVMHPDHYVQIVDRAKDIVISGGENISTVEVEAALLAHPSVSEVAVVGVPDDRWGEAVKAFVVLRAGAEVSATELQEFARQTLARFKVPKSFEFIPELPKTATGKIQKFRLRQL